MKSEHLFLWNLRQFSLADFEKPHDGKKLEKKTKRMAFVPSKSIHLLRFCEVQKITRLKTRWEKGISTKISFFLRFGLYFFSALHWKLKNYMRYQKPLKRASRWDQSRCYISIRLATALKWVLGGQKLGLHKRRNGKNKLPCQLQIFAVAKQKELEKRDCTQMKDLSKSLNLLM